MPKSYRLRTQLGVDQTLQLNVEQDFDFLELLSMKLTQGDAYTRFCADYGVVVGRVSDISLDEEDYTPVVTLTIDAQYNQFSEATSVSILTAGLLGEQYIGLLPGFMDESVTTLEPGDFIEDTKPALVLEELIGQFLFSEGSGD